MSSSTPKKSPRKKSRTLTKEEEQEIIVVYEKGGFSQRDLANKYDISKTKVQSLLKQKKESDYSTGNTSISV